MKRCVILAALFVVVACADQDEVDPCTIRVNVVDAASIQVNGTRIVEADVDVRSGVCSTFDKEIEWSSSKPDVGTITAFSQSSATVLAKKAGTTVIKAWLIRTPDVRDSISLTVTAPVDQ
jgi:hypothetical protein